MLSAIIFESNIPGLRFGNIHLMMCDLISNDSGHDIDLETHNNSHLILEWTTRLDTSSRTLLLEWTTRLDTSSRGQDYKEKHKLDSKLI